MRRLSLLPRSIVSLLPFVLFAPQAQAYVGPGLGLGALVVILGIVVSILIALIAIVWYPLKRRRAARTRATETETGH
jgi:hypothetical protein